MVVLKILYWASAFEALVMLSCGLDGVLCPREFCESCLRYWLMGLDAQAVGPLCDSRECGIDLVDELAVCSCEIEVESLLEAFGAKLSSVACGLGFACARAERFVFKILDIANKFCSFLEKNEFVLVELLRCKWRFGSFGNLGFDCSFVGPLG